MKTNFNMGSLAQWQEIGSGEIIAFDLPSSGTRSVEFQVIANGVLSIAAIDKEGYAQLIAYGEGLLDVKFTAQKNVALGFMFPEDASCFIKTRLQTQVLSETAEPSWTNIEPRQRVPTDMITRIQQLAAQNAMKRAQALMDEMDRREARLNQSGEPADYPVELIEPEAKPKKKPDEKPAEELENEGT